MNTSLDQHFAEKQKKEQQEKEFYGEIYQSLTSPEGTIEVAVGQMPMGKPFFTLQATTEWIANNVKLAGEMQMFNQEEGKYKRIGNDYGNIEITSENVELIKQRPVDFSREKDIARYLLTHPFHNLPDVVLVVSAPWVDNATSPNWDKDGRALLDSCELVEISQKTDKVLLKLGKSGSGDYTLYALDGQHRLIGIRGAIQMLENGVLTEKDKLGKAKNTVHELDEWIEESQVSSSDVLKFRIERVGIKLTPAVCKGETWEEATQRIASIFKAFNTTSVSIPKGPAAAMDKDDAFAITARKVWKVSTLLKDTKDRSARISPITNTVALKSTVLTTLATMKQMAYDYFSNNRQYADWYKPVKRRTMPQAPNTDLLEEAVDEFKLFWDHFAELPSMVGIETWENLSPLQQLATTPNREAKNVAEMRNFKSTKFPDGKSHMLFRPIGQQALAIAVGSLINKVQNPMSIDKIFDLLNEYDNKNGFCLTDQKNPWWGVLVKGYEDTSYTMTTQGVSLAAKLLEYMLSGDVSGVTVGELKEQFAKARQNKPGTAIDLQGKELPFDQIQLPQRLV
jgi:hypothetical protein